MWLPKNICHRFSVIYLCASICLFAPPEWLASHTAQPLNLDRGWHVSCTTSWNKRVPWTSDIDQMQLPKVIETFKIPIWVATRSDFYDSYFATNISDILLVQLAYQTPTANGTEGSWKICHFFGVVEIGQLFLSSSPRLCNVLCKKFYCCLTFSIWSHIHQRWNCGI